METYSQFLARISSFETKELNLGSGRFVGNPSLAQKINPDNSFRNFYGDTVVFALDDTKKALLNELTEMLYRAAPECFCERLIPSTFHVTLHDLSNSAAIADVAEEVFENELKIVRLIPQLEKYANAEIVMKSKAVFNMVNTSLVMGLYPTDEQSHRTLTELYSIFDDVKSLPYPLTPHITLAYYNIDGFGARSTKALAAAVKKLNANEFELRLNANDLYYQKFRSMNDYIDIVKLIK